MHEAVALALEGFDPLLDGLERNQPPFAVRGRRVAVIAIEPIEGFQNL
jgi:hypothetical protein